MLDTIPAPLLDRMEVLEVSGYVTEEKCMIAEKYLTPQAKEASGLKEADVTLDPSTVDMLIKYYCRESGVRNLKKHIDKVTIQPVAYWLAKLMSSPLQIYRKAALKLVQDLGEDALPEPTPASTASSSADDSTEPSSELPAEAASATVEKVDPPPNEPAAPESSTPKTDGELERTVTTEERPPLKIPDTVHLKITPENLKDYVGPPVYHKDRMYINAPPPGVSTGLGYLGNGSGAVMPIEATVCHFLTTMFWRTLLMCQHCRACLAREASS